MQGGKPPLYSNVISPMVQTNRCHVCTSSNYILTYIYIYIYVYIYITCPGDLLVCLIRLPLSGGQTRGLSAAHRRAVLRPQLRVEAPELGGGGGRRLSSRDARPAEVLSFERSGGRNFRSPGLDHLEMFMRIHVHLLYAL